MIKSASKMFDPLTAAVTASTVGLQNMTSAHSSILNRKQREGTLAVHEEEKSVHFNERVNFVPSSLTRSASTNSKFSSVSSSSFGHRDAPKAKKSWWGSYSTSCGNKKSKSSQQ